MQKPHHVLKKYFGYSSFRPGQEQIIDSILAGKDTLGIMPTGGGKSLCYQIPALCLKGITIVISPLISLMKDQVDSLHNKGYPAEMINSTVSFSRQQDILELVEAGQIPLLYLTPERFANEQFLARIKALPIALFCIDEAHCISEWGHDFRPEYRKLSKIIKELGHPPVLALTATATGKVQDDIVSVLGMRSPAVFVRGFNRENLVYGVKNCFNKEEKNRALLEFVSKVKSPGIVYVSSIKDATLVFNIISTNTRLRSGLYHGSLQSRVRKKVQEDFLDGKIDILVATNAFGMGVDKSDIRFVVHYSIPGTLESYYQETGRAGRDGGLSFCLLLALPDDIRIQEYFINAKNPPLEAIEKVFHKIVDISEKRKIYVDDAELIDLEGINKFSLGSVISILKRYHCIETDYISDTTIEIMLLKNEEDPTGVLDILFNNTLVPESVVEGSLARMAKRCDLMVFQLRDILREMSEKGIISVQTVEQGASVHCLYKTLPPLLKEQYPKKREAKISVDREKLDYVISYTELTSCRRTYVLSYFGEEFPEKNCGGCDICRGTYQSREVENLTDFQRKIVLFFYYNEKKIGMKNAVNILKGSQDVEPKYRTWDDYGLLKNQAISDIRSEIDFLLQAGILSVTKSKYRVVGITVKGTALLRKKTGKNQK